MDDFKITLRAARVNAGLKQREIAEKMGVNVTTIQNWESGESEPKTSQFAELCSIYRCPQEIIFLGKK